MIGAGDKIAEESGVPVVPGKGEKVCCECECAYVSAQFFRPSPPVTAEEEEAVCFYEFRVFFAVDPDAGAVRCGASEKKCITIQTF